MPPKLPALAAAHIRILRQAELRKYDALDFYLNELSDQGWPVQEMADVLGVTRQAVYQRMQRGKDRINMAKAATNDEEGQ